MLLHVGKCFCQFCDSIVHSASNVFSQIMVLLHVGKCFCKFCDSSVHSASNVFSQIMVLLHVGKCFRQFCDSSVHFCFKRIQSNNGVATCRKVFLPVFATLVYILLQTYSVK